MIEVFLRIFDVLSIEFADKTELTSKSKTSPRLGRGHLPPNDLSMEANYATRLLANLNNLRHNSNQASLCDVEIGKNLNLQTDLNSLIGNFGSGYSTGWKLASSLPL